MTELTAVDREVLSAVFASRITLARKSKEDALAEAVQEHARAGSWIKSNTRKEGSFLWFCEQFGIEPSAVRMTLEKK